MMQLYVNHLRTISSIEVVIRMFENLDPPKINRLKMHEDVRIDRRNPSVFAFWDGTFKVISLAFWT